jgi:hypothetical protein
MPSFRSTIFHFSALAGLLGTGGCTVYAPMQPTMPLVQKARQAEITASVQPIGRVEATLAYAPVSHLLLTAGGTLSPKLSSRNFLVSRQYELGLGGYLPLGDSWLLNGLVGFGQAVNNRGYYDLAIIFSSTYSEYNARYSKLFTQVGIANVQPRSSIGFTYRLTQVYFASLTDTRLGPLPLSRMLRHEALLFGRHYWARGERWESICTMGFSVSSTPKLDTSQGYPGYGAAEYQANRNLLPAFYASLGVVYHPDWGVHQGEAEK